MFSGFLYYQRINPSTRDADDSKASYLKRFTRKCYLASQPYRLPSPPKRDHFQLHKQFFDDLQNLNKQKNWAYPVALILWAEYDHNNAFKHLSDRFILEISKTHRMIIKKIKVVRDIQKEIDITSKFQGAIHLLCLFAHGNEFGFAINKEIEANQEHLICYKQTDIHQETFQTMHPKGTIVLCCCGVGRAQFAQTLADISQRKVLATIDKTTSLANFRITWCTEHGLERFPITPGFEHLDSRPIIFSPHQEKKAIPACCDQTSKRLWGIPKWREDEYRTPITITVTAQ